MIRRIGNSPNSFFDSTPIGIQLKLPKGVIINKFSSDLGIADSELRRNYDFLLNGFSINVLSILFACFINPPLYIIALFFL
jgi:hypothetical protein